MYTVYLLANENNYCLRFSLERAKLTNLLEAGSFFYLTLLPVPFRGHENASFSRFESIAA